MSDITVSGGGTIAVVTDEMAEHSAALKRVAVLAASSQSTLNGAAHLATGSSASTVSDLSVQVPVMRALDALDRTRDTASVLTRALERAAEEYGRAEWLATDVAEQGSAGLGWLTGALGPAALPVMGSVLASGAIALLLSSIVAGSPQQSMQRLSALASNPAGILSNPLFVSLVRATVSSVDDAMLGAAHLPYSVVRAVDDRALGWFGLRGASRTVIGLAGPDALKETPVTVSCSRTGSVAAPSGFADLASRVPSGVGKPQIRIEKYTREGERPRWVVYAGGTLDPGLVPKAEPWDDTSNIQGIADLDPASVRATLQAMKEAGVEAGDQVVSVGYSQGGIVATDVVTRGAFTNVGLITFGSPTAQVAIPPDVTNVAVEIREDLIPALGGEPRSIAQGGLDRVVVRRSIYDSSPPPSGQMLPAHGIANYRQTAEMMDQSDDERLASARAKLDEVTGGAKATVTLWRAERE